MKVWIKFLISEFILLSVLVRATMMSYMRVPQIILMLIILLSVSSSEKIRLDLIDGLYCSIFH
jgi:hypothetical protein